MELDATDRRIVALLQDDAKLSFHGVGEAVGLSPPAAFQRVRKLEAAGIITGYHARVSPNAVGRPLMAFVRVAPGPQTVVSRLTAGWRKSAAVMECHRTTGPDAFMLKLRLQGVAALGEFLDGMRQLGCHADSAIAVETVFERWVV